MTTAIIEANAAIQKVATRAKEEALDEVLDMIWAKEDAIRTILDNGRPIYEQCYGERFDEMYEKRSRLWHKLHAYNKISAAIADMRCKL